jgi:hypothetical protein
MTILCARSVTRASLVGLAAAGLVLTGLVAPSASAAPEEAIASGSVGSVDATYDDDSVQLDDLASCATDGVDSAASTPVVVRGFLEFGDGSSTCAMSGDGVASADVDGRLFRLDVLRDYGGPRIRMTDYHAQCATTENGSTASFHLGGLSGMSVPPSLPPNYVVTIPGPGPGAPPLAKVTLNETITPDPPDGSMTVNIMHIHLFPDGSPSGEVGGEIVVGSVSCAPF